MHNFMNGWGNLVYAKVYLILITNITTLIYVYLNISGTYTLYKLTNNVIAFHIWPI